MTVHTRHAIGGLLLLAMVILALLHAWLPAIPLFPAGICGWLAVLWLWTTLRPTQQKICLLLLVLGGGALIWAGQVEHKTIDWQNILAGNALLTAFLACLTFLQLLINTTAEPSGPRPQGQKALWQTLISLNLLAGVISMTAALMYAAGMATHGRLGKRRAIVVERGMCNASFWSPFRANMATVLIYVPMVQLGPLMAVGAIITAFALIITARELKPGNTGIRGAPFIGYRLTFASARMPLLIAAIVMSGHFALPEISTLAITGTTLVTLGLIVPLLTRGSKGLVDFGQHIGKRLVRSINEISLFLSVGILTHGLSLVLTGSNSWLPFDQFTALEAIIVMIIMVSLASFGVHPLIMISLFSLWLQALNPDPLLLAMTFLGSWAISAQFNPLSAPHLVIQGNYGISGFAFIRWNYRFIAKMMAFLAFVLIVLQYRHELWQQIITLW